MSIQAFDSYSFTYDEDFTHTPIGYLQRERVYHSIKHFLKKDDNVLELNCGTGEDAVYLAPYVKSVYATDRSEGMVRMARKKAEIAEVKAEFEVCAIEDVVTVTQGRRFDLIFSNFGGLNCVSPDDLERCRESFYNITKADAHIVLVIMGRKCIWERMYYLYKNNRKEAYRRGSDKGIVARVDEGESLTFYYSPSEIRKVFKNYFEIAYTKPIGLFIPPSYLNSFFKNRNWLLTILYFMEKTFGAFGILSDYADHYVVVLKKKK